MVRDRALRRARLELLRCLRRRELDLLTPQIRGIGPATTDEEAVRIVKQVMDAVHDLERLGTDARA